MDNETELLNQIINFNTNTLSKGRERSKIIKKRLDNLAKFNLNFEFGKINNDINYIMLSVLRENNYKFGETRLYDKSLLFDKNDKLKIRGYKKKTKNYVDMFYNSSLNYIHVLNELPKELSKIITEFRSEVEAYYKFLKANYCEEYDHSNHYNRYSRGKDITFAEYKINKDVTALSKTNCDFEKVNIESAEIILKLNRYSFTTKSGYVDINGNDNWSRFNYSLYNPSILVFKSMFDIAYNLTIEAENMINSIISKRNEIHTNLYNKLTEKGYAKYLMVRDL